MATSKLSTKQRERLLQAARKVMKHAHVPYSHFKVGAALLTEKGELFSGCNVENASYGLTNCAERTAIFSAVAQTGPELIIRAIPSSMNKECHALPAAHAARSSSNLVRKRRSYFS